MSESDTPFNSEAADAEQRVGALATQIDAHLDGERFKEALTTLDELMALVPDQPRLHVFRSRILFSKGDHRGAESEIKRALRMDPNYADAHYLLAAGLVQRGKWGRARRAVKHTLHLAPDWADAWVLLAAIESHYGHFREILGASDRALEIDPYHAEASVHRGWALVGLGRPNEVDHATWAAINGTDSQVRAFELRGWAALHRGDVAHAHESFLKALASQPDDTAARAGLIETLKARHRSYRWILMANLWMARHRPMVRILVIFAAFFCIGIAIAGVKALGFSEDSVVYGVASAILGCALSAALVAWLWGSWIFGQLLRFDRTARRVLAGVDLRESEWRSRASESA
jgi:Tfp pilus assembly protein PilF